MARPGSSSSRRPNPPKKRAGSAVEAGVSTETSDDPARTFDFGILRTLRQRAGLTLGDVSARSGVSVAVLSKLERNQSRGELDTLFRLARVFGLSALDLIALAEAPLSHRHQAITYDSDGFHFQRLSYSNLALFVADAKAGARVKRPEIHRDVHETCWVLTGRIRITLPHEIVELGPGEGVQFDAIQEHTYEALADCRLLLAHLTKDKRY